MLVLSTFTLKSKYFELTHMLIKAMFSVNVATKASEAARLFSL